MTWRRYVPWVTDDDPWIWVILAPLLALLVILGFLLLSGPVEWIGRLLGMKKGWVWR